MEAKKSIGTVVATSEPSNKEQEQQTTVNSLEIRFSREAFNDFKRIKRQFKLDILPEIKSRRSQESKKNKKRRTRKSGFSSSTEIMPLTSPIGRFLSSFEQNGFDRRMGQGRKDKHSTNGASLAVAEARPLASIIDTNFDFGAVIGAVDTHPTEAAPVYKLTSVFVVALFELDEPMLMIQKVGHKAKPGFPGGTIQDGQGVIETGIREFKEETGGNHKRPSPTEKSGDFYFGIDISKYVPIAIGEFLLKRQGYGEKGAVVLVRLPAAEALNVVAGAISKDEVIEWIELWSLSKVVAEADAGRLLGNSIEVMKIFLEYYISLAQ